MKIGARIVRHGRYVVFQLAEVAVPRALFAAILRRIDRLRGPPVAGGLTGANHGAAGAEGRTMCRRLAEPAGRAWKAREGWPSAVRVGLAYPSGGPSD